MIQVTKKLVGDVRQTASWMTNIANEHNQVINSFLITWTSLEEYLPRHDQAVQGSCRASGRCHLRGQGLL